jgi:hypothetical protein
MVDRAQKIYDGENKSPTYNVTDDLIWEESEWGTRTWRGEATGSTLRIRDEFARYGNTASFPSGTMPPGLGFVQLPPRNVMELTLSSNILWQGRLATTEWSRGERKPARNREIDVYAEDINIDQRGMVVHQWTRPAETDVARVQGLLAEFYSGDPSPTRNWNGSNLVNSGSNLVSLPAQTYTATTGDQILADIAAAANKTYYLLPPRVTGTTYTAELFYDGNDAVMELCPFKISDREDEVRAQPGIVWPPIWNVGPALQQDGQQILSGIWLFYGVDQESYVHETSAPAFQSYAHWEEIVYDEKITTQAEAQAKARAILSFRHIYENTVNVTIGPLTDFQIGSIRSGQHIAYKARAIPHADDAYHTGRIAQMKITTPTGVTAGQTALWFAHLEIERPKRIGPYNQGKPPGPKPPEPPTAGGCTRLYYSADTTGFTIAESSDYDDAATVDAQMMYTTPDGSYGSSGVGLTWNGVNVAADNYKGNVIPFAFQITNATLLAQIQDGGIELLGYLRARSRSGLGIDEAAQSNFPIGVVRIRRSPNTIVGTALAASAATGGLELDASSAFKNRRFGPWTLSAVPGAALNDWIIWEPGFRHAGPTSGGTGGAMLFASDAAQDLPEAEGVQSDYNAWLDLCFAGSGGTPTQPTVLPGDETVGEDNDHYSPIDHTHAHGFLADDGVHMHDADHIDGLTDPVTGGSTDQHSHPDLSEAGETTAAVGGWQWIQEPRAVAYRDRVYVGAIHGDSGDVAMTVFNSADPSTAPIEKVLHAALETDIHNNATSLVRASDKKLLTLYCGHVLANIYTRLSTTSLDTDPDLDDGFAAETNIDASLGSLSYTYPSIHQLTGETNDPIYIFYREGNANGGDWYYHTSTDNGATWSARTMILTQASKSPYLKVVPNGDSRLDFIAMDEHPLDGPNSVYHFYYEGGAFHTSDGSALTLPATNANMTQVYDGSTDPAWIWDIAIGADGFPRLAYSVWDGGTDHTYHYATWDGEEWSSEEIATAADGEIISEVPGGIALDRTDPTIAYLARQADGEMEIFRATRIGGTWTLDPVTAGSATQNQYPVALHNPYPETRTGHGIRAVYLYGTYTGEDVWDLDIGLVTASGGSSSVALSDATPLVESGAGDPGVGTEASRDDHVHPAAGGGTPPAILLESGHATPFTFDEILQESDGSDFLWASE